MFVKMESVISDVGNAAKVVMNAFLLNILIRQMFKFAIYMVINQYF